jgi:glucose-6-phosphate isomerase
LTDENKTREVRGLLEAKTQTRARRLVILTLNQKQILSQNGEAIEVIPAWEWFE